jgi:hypothetical protein
MAQPATGDRVAYSGTRDLRVIAGPTAAEHHHNWGKREAYVRIVDSESGSEVLKRPSPPLTTLWLTADGQYLVGLSNIKVGNQVQLFIISRDGRFVHEEQICCADQRLQKSLCSESISN